MYILYGISSRLAREILSSWFMYLVIFLVKRGISSDRSSLRIAQDGRAAFEIRMTKLIVRSFSSILFFVGFDTPRGPRSFNREKHHGKRARQTEESK